MLINNIIFYTALLCFEIQTLYAICKMVKIAYVHAIPKYDAYYLLIALLGLFVSNACIITSLNIHTLPNISFIIRGYDSAIYNFFIVLSIFFFGLYILRNLTFKNSFFQKNLMILLEASFIVYLIFTPMNVTGNLFDISVVQNSIFSAFFSIGQILQLPVLNNWLTLFLCFIFIIFALLFIYAEKTTKRSKEHSAIFHEYSLFLLYCLTCYIANIINYQLPLHCVLRTTLIIIILYRFIFMNHLIKKVITKERLTEGNNL